MTAKLSESDEKIMAEVRFMMAWYEKRGLSWVSPVCFILLMHCGLLEYITNPWNRYKANKVGAIAERTR